MLRKPLVLKDGAVQQMQPGDEADIPLEDRFQALQESFLRLLSDLADQGWEFTDERLIELIETGEHCYE